MAFSNHDGEPAALSASAQPRSSRRHRRSGSSASLASMDSLGSVGSLHSLAGALQPLDGLEVRTLLTCVTELWAVGVLWWTSVFHSQGVPQGAPPAVLTSAQAGHIAGSRCSCIT